MKVSPTGSAALLLLPLLACRGESGPEGPPASYVAEIEQWRTEREDSLRQPDSWLTLVGLFWLDQGENTFGADESNDLVFSGAGVPERAGTFELLEEEVVIHVEPGATVLSEGKKVETLSLVSDAAGEPTVLEMGSLRYYIIERSGRFGVRLKDTESEALASFEGLSYFPVDWAWRIEARFEPYDEPRAFRVPTVLGTTVEELSPGVAVFEVEAKEYRLTPIGNLEGALFFVFGDGTNGQETYGGGRFLYAEPPLADGTLILDFNKAYSPPCVFSAYATCPLPPRENKLPVKIEAGEKTYRSGH